MQVCILYWNKWGLMELFAFCPETETSGSHLGPATCFRGKKQTKSLCVCVLHLGNPWLKSQVSLCAFWLERVFRSWLMDNFSPLNLQLSPEKWMSSLCRHRDYNPRLMAEEDSTSWWLISFTLRSLLAFMLFTSQPSSKGDAVHFIRGRLRIVCPYMNRVLRTNRD